VVAAGHLFIDEAERRPQGLEQFKQDPRLWRLLEQSVEKGSELLFSQGKVGQLDPGQVIETEFKRDLCRKVQNVLLGHACTPLAR
jgi:hypothetical protein